ncbi:(R)-specific enoyl-CoA hydratase, partial [Mucuna pruriens]
WGTTSRLGFVELNPPMLTKSLHCSKVQSLRLRCFASATPKVLKPGDVLRKARLFTEEDVLQYSKVSCDFNPLHTDSAAAKEVGFEGPLVHGMLVASLFPRIISSHFFKTRCFKNGKLLVLDGEAMALLPTLAVEQEQHEERNIYHLRPNFITQIRFI